MDSQSEMLLLENILHSSPLLCPSQLGWQGGAQGLAVLHIPGHLHGCESCWGCDLRLGHLLLFVPSLQCFDGVFQAAVPQGAVLRGSTILGATCRFLPLDRVVLGRLEEFKLPSCRGRY